MRFTSRLAVSLLLFAFASVCWAGAETHGGGGFVCRDPSGKISKQPLSVELLDLWEAKILFHLNIPRHQTNWISQLNSALYKLELWDRPFWQKAAPFTDDILNNLKKIPPGTIIPPPTDILAPLAKKNCPLEGIAGADDENDTIYINPEITTAMDPTDYAALMFHEIVYKTLRVYDNATNSIDARRVTGYIFSDAPIPTYYPQLPADTVTCENKQKTFAFKFYQVKKKCPCLTGDTNFVFYFNRIAGWPLLGVTSGILNGSESPMRDIYDGRISEVRITAGPIGGPSFEQLTVTSPYERYEISLSRDSGTVTLQCHRSPK